ncbi:hypothetical protein BG015_000698 [Linnemannia schmuckeri]|uniref:Uncharacterized protein n=1 Tax=Linnemannia schmuckeri TaxID=64567 RepID=A0A9P5RQR8_9FUNG|nr:hypothetical protein BG015_000698 [Linnemannia schmuckeri]
MAKKRTTTRKARQAAHSGNSDNHPYRHNSKHISASPSVASSPSPQPHDLVQRRRKGIPVRSPSQGDPSKGIVFAFRIQPDSDLSMAVDILSYDQVSEEPESSSTSQSEDSSATTSKAITEAALAPSIASSTAVVAPAGSVTSSREEFSLSQSSQLKLAGEKWSSDPSSYLSNNVVDLTRNVLILHARKPQDTTGTSTTASSSSPHPYSRSAVPSRSSSMSLPSTPPLTDSSSYSSASSSPSSSPSSPTLQPFEAGVVGSEKEKNNSFPDQLSSALPLSLPLPAPMVTDLKSQPPRMLRVRGLGNGARRMQVFVV